MLQMILMIVILSLLFLPFQLSWWKMPSLRIWIPVRFVIGLVYGIILFYFGLLDQSVTAVLAYYLPIIGIGLIGDNTIVFMFKKSFSKKSATTGLALGLSLLVVIGLFGLLQPLFLADEMYSISDGEEVTIEELQPVNEQHIPVVPRSYAQYRSDIMMGQLENQAFYNLGETRIQSVDGSLYWITPIEYEGFFRWVRSDASPGYIIVSAEDPREDPQLIEREMKYVPSAFFNENLERHVRANYPDVILLDTTFEIDPDGNPFYIVSYGHFTEIRRVAEVDGVIIVNPETGEHASHTVEETPEWVNRIFPPHIAEERNTWFGIYKQGIVNRFFGREGLTQPTEWGADDSVTGVVNQNLQISWFTDHMRIQGGEGETSRSMIGFTMFNARTGELQYFRDASGSLNGRTAMDLAERTFRRDDYVAGTPSLYNIYNQYTWVVPLMDRNSVLRQVVLVNASDENIYGYGDSKREAFNAYQLELSAKTDGQVSPGEITDLVELTATVERVYKWDREDNVTVRILFEGDERIFTVNASSYPRAVFIEAGDELSIEFMDSGEAVQPIETLEY